MTHLTLLDPGRLSQRLLLEALTQTPDGCGGTNSSFVPRTDLWAVVQPAGTYARDIADQESERVTHRITIRFRDDVKSGWRFSKGERQFKILTVHDPDETGRYLICRTQEEGR